MSDLLFNAIIMMVGDDNDRNNVVRADIIHNRLMMRTSTAFTDMCCHVCVSVCGHVFCCSVKLSLDAAQGKSSIENGIDG